MTTEQAVQGRADLVAAASLDGVALSATGLEEVGTLLSVTYFWGGDVVVSCFVFLGLSCCLPALRGRNLSMASPD